MYHLTRTLIRVLFKLAYTLGKDQPNLTDEEVDKQANNWISINLANESVS